MRINIDNWEEYAIETTGKQEKKWLISNNSMYLYKEATRREDGTYALNDVSECMASDIAGLIKVCCAKYFLCERKGVKGVITPNFLNNNGLGKAKKEELILGFDLINAVDPGFKPKSFENPKTHDLYTVSLVLKSIEEYNLEIQALEMIIFHLLIGNHDCNTSNWGIIKDLETKRVRFTPLYDNGASLGIPLEDKRINKELAMVNDNIVILNSNSLEKIIHHYMFSRIVLGQVFQKDQERQWNTDHIIRNAPGEKYDFRMVEYQPMMEYLTSLYPEEISNIMDRIQTYINEDNITNIIDRYSDELDAPRRELAKMVVLERAAWMTSYYQREKDSAMGRLIS